MRWNWQLEEWPNFTYKHDTLKHSEEDFLHNTGILFGVYKHLTQDDQDKLKIELISTEALNTSEIEGEYLNRDSLQSSICHHFGIPTDGRKIPPAERGIADLMVDLYQTYNDPLSHNTLFRWHSMLTVGRSDLKDLGRYRTSSDPMQVISGPLHEPKIHFEAPPSKQIQNEMDQFIEWFHLTTPYNMKALPAMARAGIAHLYFECIHPFEDGNGRIGRALSEKVLAQAIGKPTLIALSSVINRNKKAYYDALEKANKRYEATEWLEYFASTVLEALKYTEMHINFLIEKARMFDSLGKAFNPRQTKAILRLFNAGPEGFIGGLSAENYISIRVRC